LVQAPVGIMVTARFLPIGLKAVGGMGFKPSRPGTQGSGRSSYPAVKAQ